MDIQSRALIVCVLLFIVLIVYIIGTFRHFIYLEDQLTSLTYRQLAKRLKFVSNLLINVDMKKIKYELHIENSKMSMKDQDMYQKIIKQYDAYSRRLCQITKEINLRY